MNVSITPGEAEVMKAPAGLAASTACLKTATSRRTASASLQLDLCVVGGELDGGRAAAIVVRKLFDVRAAAHRIAGRTVEAAQPLLHVGDVRDLGVLAVADDVDARVHLLLDDVACGLLDDALQLQPYRSTRRDRI